MDKILAVALMLCVQAMALAQHIVKGKVYDNETKEALAGATVAAKGTTDACMTEADGTFSLSLSASVNEILVTFIGYDTAVTSVEGTDQVWVALNPAVHGLHEVVVTANREASLRTESPVAISKLSADVIHDTRPVLMAELINKVPGVVMLNYNNEQHAMAIRQPMGTAAYFLYLEDGVPIRPMGIFNHNALIEVNLLGISSVEVIKGPASSLYGPEAVGGAINFITHRPTVVPELRVGVTADQWGYTRLQYGGGGMISKKLGLCISGFEARQRDSWQAYSDYDKSSVNGRLDFTLSANTTLALAFSGNEYYSDMAGSVDSIAFYERQYSSTTDFTYRRVHSQRTRFTVRHRWNDRNETAITLSYRDNSITQNPNYAIRWITGSTTASGEINRNSFYSRVAMLQHSTQLPFLGARVLAGATLDYSPNRYSVYRTDMRAQLRSDEKTVEKFILLGERPDLPLSDYRAGLMNLAFYSQFELSPLERLKITAGLRYDKMVFDYRNFLDQSAGRKSYCELTPKIGATYDLGRDKGVYVNYSRGFSPPGLTSVFRKKPSAGPDAANQFNYDLMPARFGNGEVGGWAAFLDSKVYIDFAVYQMQGRHEMLNVRLPDNSFEYRSAGKTIHRGIEYSITWKPDGQWLVRFGGTNAVHRFSEFTLGTGPNGEARTANGKDMPQAPHWIANGEVTFKPADVHGLRLSLEWQRISSWYEDHLNRVKYDDRTFLGLKGVSYLNLRTGYEWKGAEVFLNVMNLTDELYANAATRGDSKNDHTAFTPAAPRTFVMGVQYKLTGRK